MKTSTKNSVKTYGDSGYIEYVARSIWDDRQERLLAVINGKPVIVTAHTLMYWSFLNKETDPFNSVYTVGLVFISEGGRLYFQPEVQVFGRYEFKDGWDGLRPSFTINCVGKSVATSTDPIEEADAIATTLALLPNAVTP